MLPDVCWVIPNFWEGALIAEKKIYVIYELQEIICNFLNKKFLHSLIYWMVSQIRGPGISCPE